ncbi:MAG TPA: hypothetical protein PKI03_30805 [Pseudomonadota bacterium]|nr:hypothetical protein [Pseudomonadota bacterium]
MRELLNRTKERLRARRAEKDSPPSSAAQNPNDLQSVDGIMNSAARLGTLAFAVWAAKTVGEIWNAGKKELEDERRAARNEEKARRDLAETQKRSDEKDTAAIRRDIRKDWVERERKNLPPAPKSIRGHWEGHVFIPNEQPGKAAPGTSGARPKSPTKTPPKAKTSPKTKTSPKAAGG